MLRYIKELIDIKYTLRVPHVEQELAYPSRAPAFTPV